LAQLAEDELKVFPDGALYINNVRLIHAGNYTCHAQRNKDVVQTHALHVHSTYTTHHWSLSFFLSFIFFLFVICPAKKNNTKKNQSSKARSRVNCDGIVIVVVIVLYPEATKTQ
jgi:sulfur relay (sulfurtransferase) DsrC/TusE family protein